MIFDKVKKKINNDILYYEMKTEIDKYLDDCPFFDYQNEKNVHNYAGSFLRWLIQNFFKILDNSLKQKANQDYKQLCGNPDLQNIALYYEEVRKILYYLEKKYIVKKQISHHLSIIHKLLQKSVIKLSSVISLYCAENFDDFYAIYRNIYEHFVLFSYILDNENVSDAFIDHSFMTFYLLKEELGTITDEEKSKKATYESLYGDKFKLDYGWAQNKFQKKDKVVLKDLISVCPNKKMIDEYAFNYSYACKFVHASSYSVYAQDSSNIGPLLRTIVFMINYEMTSFIDCLKTTNKESVLLKKISLELSKIVEASIRHFEK